MNADHTLAFQYIFSTDSNIIYLIVVCLLMILNWGIEAIKWQLLIYTAEPISFCTSLQSIFSGVTISIFTPNRVGEFAGRIFFLKQADKIQATVKSFIGSALQLMVTALAGIIAVIMYSIHSYNAMTIFNITFKSLWLYIIIFAAGTIIFVFIGYKKPISFVAKIKSAVTGALKMGRMTLLYVFLLSVLRYSVFTIQYYLILSFMSVDIDFITACILIAIVFFITAAIPTFALTEILVRSAVAVSVFKIVHADALAVVAASLLLWIINLAIPALIGSIFVWKLQFFKQ